MVSLAAGSRRPGTGGRSRRVETEVLLVASCRRSRASATKTSRIGSTADDGTVTMTRPPSSEQCQHARRPRRCWAAGTCSNIASIVITSNVPTSAGRSSGNRPGISRYRPLAARRQLASMPTPGRARYRSPGKVLHRDSPRRGRAPPTGIRRTAWAIRRSRKTRSTYFTRHPTMNPHGRRMYRRPAAPMRRTRWSWARRPTPATAGRLVGNRLAADRPGRRRRDELRAPGGRPARRRAAGGAMHLLRPPRAGPTRPGRPDRRPSRARLAPMGRTGRSGGPTTWAGVDKLRRVRRRRHRARAPDLDALERAARMPRIGNCATGHGTWPLCSVVRRPRTSPSTSAIGRDGRCSRGPCSPSGASRRCGASWRAARAVAGACLVVASARRTSATYVMALVLPVLLASNVLATPSTSLNQSISLAAAFLSPTLTLIGSDRGRRARSSPPPLVPPCTTSST